MSGGGGVGMYAFLFLQVGRWCIYGVLAVGSGGVRNDWGGRDVCVVWSRWVSCQGVGCVLGGRSVQPWGMRSVEGGGVPSFVGARGGRCGVRVSSGCVEGGWRSGWVR